MPLSLGATRGFTSRLRASRLNRRDEFLRNTREIPESFGPLAPSRMYSRGGHGPAVRFTRGSPDDAIDAADDEGRPAPRRRRHPVQVERTDFHDQEGYGTSYWDDDVFYGHVLGCKDVERRAVVLCINEDGSRDRARERLYVGMSRATDQLVVVGNPETIRRVAGDDVARRLGIG